MQGCLQDAETQHRLLPAFIECVQVSVNDFIVRAVALALKQVPNANAAWDDKAEQIRAGSSVDVAIAVATDKGLITPIVKAADTKSLQQVLEPFMYQQQSASTGKH